MAPYRNFIEKDFFECNMLAFLEQVVFIYTVQSMYALLLYLCIKS